MSGERHNQYVDLPTCGGLNGVLCCAGTAGTGGRVRRVGRLAMTGQLQRAGANTLTARASDADFDSFVRTSTPALLRAAYLLTGDQHLAEDLVQSTLARTHLSWARLQDT